MNTDLKRFIAKTVVLSAFIALIGWLAFSLFIPQYYLPIFPYLLIFFLVVAISVHAYQLMLARKDMAKFTRSNMLVTFIKLVIYSIFAIIYIANDSENALAFVVALFLLYLIFSFVEVAEITRISKRNTK
jgi:hypothetical protein